MATSTSFQWAGDNIFILDIADTEPTADTRAILLAIPFKVPFPSSSTQKSIATATSVIHSGKWANYTTETVFIGYTGPESNPNPYDVTLTFTGSTVVGDHIEKVYFRRMPFNDARRERDRIAYSWETGGYDAANAYLEASTWDYVFTRAETLATPTGLNADNITSNSARTNWQAVENASNYKVQYKAAGDTVWTETYTD